MHTEYLPFTETVRVKKTLFEPGDGMAKQHLLPQHQAGLSQRELASLCNLKRVRISSFEQGRRYPSDEERKAICEALDLENVTFLKEGPTPKALSPRKSPKKKLPSHANLTDPESACIRRLYKGSIQGFNPQLAVDSDHQVVVGLFVSNETTDRNNLIPMGKQLVEQGLKPKELSGDSGYYRTELFSNSSLQGIELFVPPDRKLKGKFKNPCPQAEAMREKLSSDEGKAKYNLRGQTVEPVFGDWKHCKGFKQFLTRGIENVTTELTLMATVHNMLKLMKYGA